MATATQTETQTREHVRDAMTRNPATATRSDSLHRAASLMVEHDCGAIPVVESGKVVGIITDRDIVVRTIAEKRDPSSRTVGDIMSHDVAVVRDDESLAKAFSLMSRNKVRRLPVVDSSDKLIGILAQADLALESDQDRELADTVERISEPGR